MVEIGRDLHGELASRSQHRSQSRKERAMIADPLQRRVGEDDIEQRLWLPVTDIAARKPQAVALERTSPLEHRVRRIDAKSIGGLQLAMQFGGEQPGSASEIDHASGLAFGDQRHQVVKRLLTLCAKTLVLRRIPGVAHAHAVPGARSMGSLNIGRQDSVARCDPECGAGLPS